MKELVDFVDEVLKIEKYVVNYDVIIYFISDFLFWSERDGYKFVLSEVADRLRDISEVCRKKDVTERFKMSVI